MLTSSAPAHPSSACARDRGERQKINWGCFKPPQGILLCKSVFGSHHCPAPYVKTWSEAQHPNHEPGGDNSLLPPAPEICSQPQAGGSPAQELSVLRKNSTFFCLLRTLRASEPGILWSSDKPGRAMGGKAEGNERGGKAADVWRGKAVPVWRETQQSCSCEGWSSQDTFPAPAPR